MQITKTTHPPAGATAFLAAISPEIYVMVLPPCCAPVVDARPRHSTHDQQHSAPISRVLVRPRGSGGRHAFARSWRSGKSQSRAIYSREWLYIVVLHRRGKRLAVEDSLFLSVILLHR